MLDEAVEFWNIDRVSRRWSKAQGKSPMDLWSEANFQKIKVDYTQFLLYAEESKARVMGKKHIEMRPYEYVPTAYIEAGSKVLVRVNINASNEALSLAKRVSFSARLMIDAQRLLHKSSLKPFPKNTKVPLSA